MRTCEPGWDTAGTASKLTIGLVNNMSIPALRSTRSQFDQLLRAASGSREVTLLAFTLGRFDTEVDGHVPISIQPPQSVDGLIVTGMEPSTEDLRSERIWGELTQLQHWAERAAIPVVWSCLAAHAAVLHADGILRRKFPGKLSGIFECALAAPAHPLASGLPPRWRIPHSRHNGLTEEALLARGYTVLSRSAAAGVDVFARNNGAWCLYFQGHPEYRADNLLREYLRDLRRYLAGESSWLPTVPADYLDEETDAGLRALRARAQAGEADILSTTMAFARHARFRHDWSDVARQLFANWLDAVAARAEAAQAPSWPHLPAPNGVAGHGMVAH